MSMLPLILVWLAVAQVDATADRFAVAAKEAKAKDIAAAKQVVDEREEQLKAAVRAKDVQRAKMLRADAAAASLALTRARNKPLDEYIEKAKAAEEQKAAQAAEEAKQIASKRKKAAQRAEVIAEKRKAGPIFIESAIISQNLIGLPEINMTVSNNSISTVEAYDCEVQCFTAFGEPVKSPFGQTKYAAACAKVIRPGDELSTKMQLSLHSGTAKAKIWITRVKLSTGEVWTQTEEQAEATAGAMFTATTPK